MKIAAKEVTRSSRLPTGDVGFFIYPSIQILRSGIVFMDSPGHGVHDTPCLPSSAEVKA